MTSITVFCETILNTLNMFAAWTAVPDFLYCLPTGHRLAVLSNGALKFSRVTLGDAGTYQCLAKNDAGVAVGRTKLVLQGNVSISQMIENAGFSILCR